MPRPRLLRKLKGYMVEQMAPKYNPDAYKEDDEYYESSRRNVPAIREPVVRSREFNASYQDYPDEKSGSRSSLSPNVYDPGHQRRPSSSSYHSQNSYSSGSRVEPVDANGYPVEKQTRDAPPSYEEIDNYNSEDEEDENEDYSGPQISDDQMLDQALEFTRHRPPPYDSITRLSLPVIVPPVANGIALPFARCYAPNLRGHGVSEEEFIEFIDNLNIVTTANAPLQLLGIAGGIASFAPSAIAMAVGTAVQVGAKVGTAITSRKRVKEYLDRANKQFFRPRRLVVHLIGTKDLMKVLGMPPNSPLLSSFTSDPGNADLTVQERRLAALDGRISAVTFDVPPPTKPTTILSKMSAMQVKRDTAKSERRMMKGRRRQMKRARRDLRHGRVAAGADYSQADVDIAQIDRQIEMINRSNESPRQKEQDVSRLLRQRDRLISGGQPEFSRRRDREQDAAQSMTWLLVQSLD